jgi:hypothetical protein
LLKQARSCANINPKSAYEYLRRKALITKYSQLSKYQDYEVPELKILINKQRNKILISDTVAVISNIIIVTWLYFNHFEYVNNNYEMTSSINIERCICLGLAIITCISIIAKAYNKRLLKDLEFILGLRSKCNSILILVASAELKLLKIILEIIINLIQPYPFLNIHFKMMILGNTVIYSSSMILYAFCMIRLYIVFKLLRYWNTYTNDKAVRLFKFFNNKMIYLFLYKTSIKEYGFLALTVIFFIFIYVSALIFKIFEHNITTDPPTGFAYFLNCLWFLVVTMTTSNFYLYKIVGYGDYTPLTMIGRIIGVCCCIIGIILTSLVVFTLTVYIQFIDENEVNVKNI